MGWQVRYAISSAPATDIVTQLVNALTASGGGELDYSALGTVLFDLAGLKP